MWNSLRFGGGLSLYCSSLRSEGSTEDIFFESRSMLREVILFVICVFTVGFDFLLSFRRLIRVSSIEVSLWWFNIFVEQSKHRVRTRAFFWNTSCQLSTDHDVLVC